ncbi:hypothetical protein [Sulfolobus polyhedral virus 1]|uniref:Uncharacterized protein n=1 Tax=Sulfolobus polyhedral virus 1 TaxID=1982658 RepID=A0A1W6I148_SPV1|nr:hypothetical protein DT302_gp06 [Sulfolobus polyhedral virus 1]ARM37788.1 hypothetical protein [Sulfolobus polyhedral virus 1]
MIAKVYNRFTDIPDAEFSSLLNTWFKGIYRAMGKTGEVSCKPIQNHYIECVNDVFDSQTLQLIIDTVFTNFPQIMAMIKSQSQ